MNFGSLASSFPSKELAMVQILQKETGKILLKAKNDSLRGCKLAGYDLSGADFGNQDLSGCKFSGCNLSESDFRGAKFEQCKIESSILKRCSFSGANLSHADLSDNVFDNSTFKETIAVGTLFRHCKINNANFSKADLTKADFFFSELRSDFTNAILYETNLFGADLTTADFTKADLRKANMTDCRIARAIFAYAKMEGCIGTNGQPWGFAVKAKSSKKPWWKVWESAND